MSSLAHIWNSLRTFYEARHEPENMRPLAELYWRVLLISSLVALAGILSFGVWEFIGVTQKLNAGAGLKSSEQSDILTRKDLSEILDLYRARQAEFDAAKASRATVPDPSR
ncbi:MAG: hypothetical protein ACYCZ0_05005 [Minisyncoccota bacterium]